MILKLETDINANNGPCLAQLGYGEIPQMFVKGLVEDVASEAAKYEDKFSAGAYGMMTVGDAVVGIPKTPAPWSTTTTPPSSRPLAWPYPRRLTSSPLSQQPRPQRASMSRHSPRTRP